MFLVIMAISLYLKFSFLTSFNYLKLGFSEIEEDEIFELENYCNKWAIKQNKWKKDFAPNFRNCVFVGIKYI